MGVDKPIVTAADLDRVVLMVGEPMDELWARIAMGMEVSPLRTDRGISVPQISGKTSSGSVNLQGARAVVRPDRTCKVGLCFLAKGAAVQAHGYCESR